MSDGDAACTNGDAAGARRAGVCGDTNNQWSEAGTAVALNGNPGVGGGGSPRTAGRRRDGEIGRATAGVEEVGCGRGTVSARRGLGADSGDVGRGVRIAKLAGGGLECTGRSGEVGG